MEILALRQQASDAIKYYFSACSRKLKNFLRACSFLYLLFFVLCTQSLLISNIALATPADVQIPVASNLEITGATGKKMRAPVLLYFSDPECNYCIRLEEEVLKPMLRSGDYDERVLLIKIDWHSPEVVKNFNGSGIEQRALSEHYKVKVTPSLIFVDPGGREIAQRILGFQSADFFWYYLDQSIEKSRTELMQELR